MKNYAILGLLVLSQVILPTLAFFLEGLVADIIFYLYPFLFFSLIVILQCTKKFTLHRFLERQSEYILCYCLATMNIIIAWHAYKIQKNSQNSMNAFVTYTTCYL